MPLRDYQGRAVQSIFDYFEQGNTGNPVVAMPTACHGKGTSIMMYDGSSKLVEDIIVSDKLMGPDSKPRVVLSLASGNEQMVKITPLKGEEFVVNINHILSLYKTRTRSEKSGRCYNADLPSIENVTVSKYINSTKYFKHLRKLRRVSVDFQSNLTLPIHPYFLGIYIGDGCGIDLTFSSIESHLIDSFTKELDKFKDEYYLDIKRPTLKHKPCFKVSVSKFKNSNLYKQLSCLNLQNFNSANVFVPHIYKTSSREDRIEILSGLIDTDGHKCWSNTYDYISKSKKLADDIVFISRSLGLAAYVSKCTKTCQNNFSGIYYRVSISGDLSILNCRTKYKQCEPRKQIKNVLVTGFKTELLSNDNFYGFELDKDHLYLTSDFIVHHNTGKSWVIGGFLERVLSMWVNQRIMVLTHVKEIISQNYEKMHEIWPNAPTGIYSAGLNQKDIMQPIIYGGVQSVVNVAEAFGHRDLLLVDECHLVSPKDNTMYQNVIARLKIINPQLKVIGFSATPYRLGQGMITDDGIFTDICCDLTTVDEFNRLIAQGHISPLIAQPTSIEVDTSDIGIVNGDYAVGKSDDAADRVMYEALKETVEKGYNRKSWMIFTTGIKSADHAAEILNSFGISAVSIHSKIKGDINDQSFMDYKQGKIRAICGCNKFLIGFDHKPADLIADLAPTVSPGKHVQKLGRLTRPYDGLDPVLSQYFPEPKINGLVLDFAGNIRRLGPINDPKIPKKKGKGTGDVPIKICDGCGTYNHAAARFCCNDDCDMEFKFQTKLSTTSHTASPLRSDAPVIENFSVDRVIYHRHEKNGKPPSIKVSYYSGIRMFNEYVCLQHKGYARKRGLDWWRQRHEIEPPSTTDEALSYISELRVPTKVRVWVNKSYPEIMSVEW